MPVNNCCCGTQPELCSACVNNCYRIAGYVDGDLTPASGNCASAYSGAASCNGGGLSGIPWDGTFFDPVSSAGPTCVWNGSCNNVSGSTKSDSCQCVSGVLNSGIGLIRTCSGSTVTQKLLFVNYVNGAGSFRTLWQGTGSLASPEMTGVYTRTAGDSAGPASFTVEHC